MKTFKEFIYEKSMKTNIEVFGEMHFIKNEPQKIINKVVLRMPDILVLENYYDDIELYDKIAPNIKKYRLEDDLYTGTDLSLKSLEKQFNIRENNMVKNLKYILEKNKNKKIIIVVGDTHLREQNVKELGLNIFRKYLDTIKDITIHRSKNREIT